MYRSTLTNVICLIRNIFGLSREPVLCPQSTYMSRLSVLRFGSRWLNCRLGHRRRARHLPRGVHTRARRERPDRHRTRRGHRRHRPLGLRDAQLARGWRRDRRPRRRRRTSTRQRVRLTTVGRPNRPTPHSSTASPSQPSEKTHSSGTPNSERRSLVSTTISGTPQT